MKRIFCILFPIFLSFIPLTLGCIAFERSRYIISYMTFYAAIVLSTISPAILICFKIDDKFNYLKAFIKDNKHKDETCEKNI
jgi:hypothetical protein